MRHKLYEGLKHELEPSQSHEESDQKKFGLLSSNYFILQTIYSLFPVQSSGSANGNQHEKKTFDSDCFSILNSEW